MFSRKAPKPNPLGLPPQVARFFTILALLGLVCTVVDTTYSGRFGLTYDEISGIGMGAVSLASGCLLVVAIALYRMGFIDIAKGLAAVWACCFVFNIFTNTGVATANRMAEVQEAKHTAGTFKDHTKTRDEAEANLKTFGAQLARLHSDFRDLTAVKVGDWTATAVPASVPDLEVLIVEKEAERAREANRVKCGPICEQRAREKAHLIKLKGVAVKIAKLEGQITATKRVLEDARKTVATADTGISNVANASGLVARWTIGWFTDGNTDSAMQNTNEGLGIGLAFVIAVAAAGTNVAGAWPYLMQIRPMEAMPLKPQGFEPSGSGSMVRPEFPTQAPLDPPRSTQGTELAAAAVPGTTGGAPAAPAGAAAPQHATTYNVGVMNDEETRQMLARISAGIHGAIKGHMQRAA
jgi:hypothetical protein